MTSYYDAIRTYAWHYDVLRHFCIFMTHQNVLQCITTYCGLLCLRAKLLQQTTTTSELLRRILICFDVTAFCELYTKAIVALYFLFFAEARRSFCTWLCNSCSLNVEVKSQNLSRRLPCRFRRCLARFISNMTRASRALAWMSFILFVCCVFFIMNIFCRADLIGACTSVHIILSNKHHIDHTHEHTAAPHDLWVYI